MEKNYKNNPEKYNSGCGAIALLAVTIFASTIGALVLSKPIQHTCETFRGYSNDADGVQMCKYGEEDEKGIFPSALCNLQDITKKLGHEPEVGTDLSFKVREGILDDEIISNSVEKCKEGEGK